MTSKIFDSIRGTINIVTGCGSGLGRATLKRLLDKGCLGVIGIDQYYSQNFHEEFGNEKRLLIRTHNTHDDEAARASLELGMEKFGRLDNVINVAGVAAAFSLLSTTSDAPYGLNHLRDLIDFNIIGTFNISRLAVKYMVMNQVTGFKDDSPNNSTKCIINTSCISTEDAIRGQSGYSASKGAIDSMTLELARELAPHRIRTNTINVGHFDTKLTQFSALEVMEFFSKEVNLLPRRLGEPDEFAHLVQTILENQMLNGSCIRLDAGSRPNIFSVAKSNS